MYAIRSYYGASGLHTIPVARCEPPPARWDKCFLFDCIKRIYIGMESGNASLLEFLKKPGNPEDSYNFV